MKYKIYITKLTDKGGVYPVLFTATDSSKIADIAMLEGQDSIGSGLMVILLNDNEVESTRFGLK